MPHFHVLSGAKERCLKLCVRHRRQLSSYFDALGPSIPDSCGHLPEPVAVRPFGVSLPDRSRGLSQFQARISGPSVSRYVHDCPPDRHIFACVPAVRFTPDRYVVACAPADRSPLVIQALGRIGPIAARAGLTWDDIRSRGPGDPNRELGPMVIPDAEATAPVPRYGPMPHGRSPALGDHRWDSSTA
jgi:hypothetical protein